MKNILYCTDFSPAAESAGGYAGALAQSYNSSLTLYHSYSLPLIDPYAPMFKYEQIVQGEERTSELKLKAVADKIQKTYSLQNLEIITDNTPAIEAVKNISEKKESDLIIMGAAGTGGFTKIFGSTTAGIVVDIQKPVLIVPPDSKYKEFRKIVCATDLGNYDYQCFAFLGEIAGFFKAEIIFVHIGELKQNKHKESLYHIQDEIMKNINYDRLRFEEFHYDDAEEGLKLINDAHKPDLLVLVRHERSFFDQLFHRSLTKKMIYNANAPLLILHG